MVWDQRSTKTRNKKEVIQITGCKGGSVEMSEEAERQKNGRKRIRLCKVVIK